MRVVVYGFACIGVLTTLWTLLYIAYRLDWLLYIECRVLQIYYFTWTYLFDREEWNLRKKFDDPTYWRIDR